MKKMSIFIGLLVTLFAVVYLCTPLQARPTRDRILGDLLIVEQPEQVDVNIGFNFPIRYIRHFPDAEGDDLRIQLKPIAVGQSDRDALFKREAFTVDQDNAADITEVIYEGADITGLVLTVYFNKARSFSVAQGNDYRSIQLVVKKSDSQPPSE